MASRDGAPPRPSPVELEILRVLWRRGPSTVREVHHELKDARDAGYYTYLKVLQIMDQKGLVRRDKSQRAHVYEAAISETGAEHHLVTDMLERCFEGSTQKLIMRALETRRCSRPRGQSGRTGVSSPCFSLIATRGLRLCVIPSELASTRPTLCFWQISIPPARGRWSA